MIIGDVSVGIYLTVTMTLTSLSIALTVFILHLHHVGPSSRRRVPSWMRRFIIHRLGLALGVRHPAVSGRRSNAAADDHATSSRQTRAANSVDPDVGTAASSIGGYTPLAVRPVREDIVENAVSPPTERGGRRNACQDAVTRHLRLYLDRHRAEQELEDTIAEWRLVALIFDRLMFWVFLVGIASSTIFILLILPLTKPDSRQSASHEPGTCKTL